jgi:pilus assembly protein CpaF
MNRPDERIVHDVCVAVADEHGDVEELIDAALRRLAPLATSHERQRLRAVAVARLTGLSELDALVADPNIDEILVNDREIWIDRRGELVRIGSLSAITTEQVIERILAPIGRRVDRTSPIVDARLPGGARVCAVVPPVSMNGATLSIRRFAASARRLDDFTNTVGRRLCADIVRAGCNVVVCGATSSGKTSLLAALIAEVDDSERIIVLEDTSELPCDAPHLVRMEARPESAEGLAAIPLEQLVRTALRLRPDRLVVGEVRGNEVLALTQAMNTGHDGSFSTCHANGPLDALLRLESLVLAAAPQWPLAAVRQQLARSIDVVVHVTRRGRERRIATIAEVVVPPDESSRPALRDLARLDTDDELVRCAQLERTRRG